MSTPGRLPTMIRTPMKENINYAGGTIRRAKPVACLLSESTDPLVTKPVRNTPPRKVTRLVVTSITQDKINTLSKSNRPPPSSETLRRTRSASPLKPTTDTVGAPVANMTRTVHESGVVEPTLDLTIELANVKIENATLKTDFLELETQWNGTMMENAVLEDELKKLRTTNATLVAANTEFKEQQQSHKGVINDVQSQLDVFQQKFLALADDCFEVELKLVESREEKSQMANDYAELNAKYAERLNTALLSIVYQDLLETEQTLTTKLTAEKAELEKHNVELLHKLQGNAHTISTLQKSLEMSEAAAIDAESSKATILAELRDEVTKLQKKLGELQGLARGYIDAADIMELEVTMLERELEEAKASALRAKDALNIAENDEENSSVESAKKFLKLMLGGGKIRQREPVDEEELVAMHENVEMDAILGKADFIQREMAKMVLERAAPGDEDFIKDSLLHMGTVSNDAVNCVELRLESTQHELATVTAECNKMRIYEEELEKWASQVIAASNSERRAFLTTLLDQLDPDVDIADMEAREAEDVVLTVAVERVRELEELTDLMVEECAGVGEEVKGKWFEGWVEGPDVVKW